MTSRKKNIIHKVGIDLALFFEQTRTLITKPIKEDEYIFVNWLRL